jgi:hypothetical protein
MCQSFTMYEYITFVIYILIMSLHVIVLKCGWVSCEYVCGLWPVAALGLFTYDWGSVRAALCCVVDIGSQILD